MVIVILAVLIGVSISGVVGYIDKARRNVDINNASTLGDALSTLSTKDEVCYWARQSNETHLITWSFCEDGLKESGFRAKYFIPDDSEGAGKFNDYSWAYLFSRYITLEFGDIILPVSRTGYGFIVIITRDGKGLADFHTYAMCDLSQTDLEYLRYTYNIPDKYWSKIDGKGGRK